MGKRMVNPTIRHFITKLLLIMFLFLLPYSKIHATSNDIITKTLSGILNWQKMNYNLSSNDSLLASEFTDASGSSNADWFVFGMARSGVADYYHVYQNALSDGLITRYANRTELANEKPTEWHRLCLTILALGGDPTSITCSDTKQSINLIKDGVYDRSDLMSLKSQGLNSYIWALITIDSIRYPIPKESNCSRESLIQSILSYQLKDGGFSLSSTGCDVDITAMAIQALSPYYNLEQSFSYIRKCDGKKIDETIRSVIDRSLHILSQSQGKDGDFMSYGESNVESTSQVLVALCSLGIDYKTDSRFIKKGHTVLDGILKYKQKDGGFAHCIQRDKHSDVMASGQVFYSLSALLRYKDHLRNLYDLRPSMDAKTTNRIASLTKKIQAITIHSKKDFISMLYDEYCKIEPSERCYVHNYFQLSDAMKRNDLPISHPTLLSDFEHISSPSESAKVCKNTGIMITQTILNEVVSLPSRPNKQDLKTIKRLQYLFEHAKNRTDHKDTRNNITSIYHKLCPVSKQGTKAKTSFKKYITIFFLLILIALLIFLLLKRMSSHAVLMVEENKEHAVKQDLKENKYGKL